MHRNWPWLGWSHRTLLAFDALGLVVAVAYIICYFVIELHEPARTLIGVGGIVVLATFVYVTYGAHLASNLSDPDADQPL